MNSTTNVRILRYTNITIKNTEEKNKSIKTETDLLVINSLIGSSSLPLAIIFPTFLDSNTQKAEQKDV